MKKIFLAMAIAIVTGTAVSAQDDDKEDKIVVSTHQTDKEDGYEGHSASRCGIKFNFQLTGVTKVELESVDGFPLAGTATTQKTVQGKTAIDDMVHTSTIITYSSSNKSGFIPGKDYYISTLPCDLYGGYRLSIYRDGLVAHYFGVHQKVELGEFISPDDLVESELEFDKPGAPLVEEGRPKMDSKTHNLFVQYRKKPTEVNKQALLDQMCVRYDKVVARKKTSFVNWSVKPGLTALWNICKVLWAKWYRIEKSASNSNFFVSSILEGTRTRKTLGWCCVAHQLPMLISAMHPSPMPSMPPSSPDLPMKKDRTTIRL